MTFVFSVSTSSLTNPCGNRCPKRSKAVPLFERCRIRFQPRRRCFFNMSMQNRTAVVTGATKGIGRGIAMGLAHNKFHVIITGRTKSGPHSLDETADAIRKAGSTCETYVVDHSNDEQVSKFFQQLTKSLSKSGRTLDVFINNVYAAVDFLTRTANTPYWEKRVHEDDDNPGAVWDIVNGVGLRNHFVCCVYATRIMLSQAYGVIVNITSWGGLASIFDVAYCIGKSGVDRLSAELSLRAPDNINVFTFCPGFVGTETLLPLAQQQEEENPDNKESFSLWNVESPLFVGKVLAAVVSDRPFLDQVRGKIVITAEAGDRYNIQDENGNRPLSMRSLQYNLLRTVPALVHSPLRHLFPRSLLLPWVIVKTKVGTVRYWN